MKHLPALAVLLGLTIPAPALAQAMTRQRAAAIDHAVAAGMARIGAQGMALAVIERGKVVLVRSYGQRDTQGTSLQTDTVMYGASLTKAVFAYTVMRLIDEGKFTLDTPISAMLPRPLPDYGNVDGYGQWGDLAGDERWRAITPRVILTHSTGFANYGFMEPDEKLKIHFAPGTRFAYSGEGINLLQFALEQGLGLKVRDEIRRLTFEPLGMTRSDLVWQPEWAENAAQGWRADGQAFGHARQRRTRAAGSMDTTIEDVARFAAALSTGKGLSKASFAELSRPQLPITTRTQFPTLQDELPPGQRIPGLAAGLGVETFTGPQGPGFYKGGHNDFTGNMMLCLKRRARCLVVLGNDVRVEALFPELTREVLGETGTNWAWKFPELTAAAKSGQ